MHFQAGRARILVSIRSTCAIGVSGMIPWPRLNMKGPLEKASRTASTSRSSAAPPATKASGSALPCTGTRDLDLIARIAAIDHPVQCHRIDPDALDIAPQRRSAASRKADDLCPGDLAANALHDAHDRLNAPAVELEPARVSRPSCQTTGRHPRRPGVAHKVIDRRLAPGARSAGRTPSGSRYANSRAGAWSGVPSRRPYRLQPSMARRRNPSNATLRGSALRTSLIASNTLSSAVEIDLGRKARQARRGRSAATSRGPSPASKVTVCPSACGTTRMSENSMAASNLKRRTGCNVTSAASLGREAEIEE